MRLGDVVRLASVVIVIASDHKSFANSILSLECPGKSVPEIRQQSFQLELALVLYYVSWCRESRAAKDVYTEVARHYQDDISFAAVDCWHLECNCSQTIPSSLGSKKGYPQKWPTLMVHYGRHYTTLEYRDDWSVASLSQFIDNLMRPVLRLNSKAELKMLNMRNNAVLLGLFQNATAIEYHRFTKAAVKWLENDPEKLVVFAVCLGSAANDILKDLGTSMPLIVLVTDKEIQIVNYAGQWNSNQLNAWLLTEVKRLNKHFMGFSTPLILLDHVRRGTVLVIFLKDSEHSNTNFYAHMSNVLQSLYMMRLPTNSPFQIDDHYSTENLLVSPNHTDSLKMYEKRNKAELQIVFAKLLTKFAESIAQNSTTRHNRTLSVQILNLNRYHEILKTLGVFNHEIENNSKTTAIIVEPNQEGIYVMEKPFHFATLLSFIKDYYNDNLSIARKTGSISSSTSEPSSIYNLQDLSRQAFLHRIKHYWHNTTTVLLLYTPRCAFSSMMSHALVQISVFLHNTQNFHHISMVRLNTQTNDLPWELTIHLTPALIVFPRGRPSESHLFPTNLRIDVRNVFAFILAQLEPIEQVRIALSSCSPPTKPRMKCLDFVRTLAMQHISDHLKLWQIFENERQAILSRLRQFKDITLDIQKRFLL